MIFILFLGLFFLLHGSDGVRSVVVEDVTGRQLKAALNTEELIAVYWCKFMFLFH